MKKCSLFFVILFFWACAPFYSGSTAKEVVANAALVTCAKAEFRIMPDDPAMMSRLVGAGYQVVGHSEFNDNSEKSIKLAEEKAFELGACLVFFGKTYPLISKLDNVSAMTKGMPEKKFSYRAIYAVKTK
jgi:hypothetical protein